VGAKSDLGKTQHGNSLSLRERARVRGNQTLPTKTAGQILQAQLDRLPEPPYTGLEFLLILVSTKIALLTELGAVRVMDG